MFRNKIALKIAKGKNKDVKIIVFSPDSNKNLFLLLKSSCDCCLASNLLEDVQVTLQNN